MRRARPMLVFVANVLILVICGGSSVHAAQGIRPSLSPEEQWQEQSMKTVLVLDRALELSEVIDSLRATQRSPLA